MSGKELEAGKDIVPPASEQDTSILKTRPKMAGISGRQTNGEVLILWRAGMNR